MRRWTSRCSLGLASSVVLCTALAPSARSWGGTSHGIVENRGQLDAPAVYYAPFGDLVTLFFKSDAVILDFTKEHHAVYMHLEGVSPDAQIEALCPSASTLNYFLGNDASRWATDLRTYQEIVYREAWPGIDLYLSPEPSGLGYRFASHSEGKRGCVPETERAVEQDLSMRVGADQVRFRYEGTDRQDTLPDGSIRLGVSSRVLLDLPLEGDRSAGFLQWDSEPVSPGPGPSGPSSLLWSTYFGAGNFERSHGLAVDTNGNAFVTGYTRSVAFPTSPGAYDVTQNGEYDVFVTKFESDGSGYIWSTFLGGLEWDRAFGLELDAQGNPTLTGLTFSPDFPTTPGAYDRTWGGGSDTFVAKLSPTGSTLIWSTFIGGSLDDRPWDMILDAEGRPLMVGETLSPDYPVTAGAYDTSFNGVKDACVTKLDADGTNLVWSTFLGAEASEQISSVGIGPDQGPIVTGSTGSSNFPTTPGVVDTTHNGGTDCFIAKFNEPGETLVYCTLLGGLQDDNGNKLGVLPSGEAIVTGSTQSAGFPTTTGAYDETYNGGQDIFATRLSFDGTELTWCTLLGGSANDAPFAFTLDLSGALLISGGVSSPEFPTTPDAFDQTFNGDVDAFLTWMDNTGSQIYWSSFLGGNAGDGGWDLALHPTGNPILTGPTYSGDFPTTEGAYDRTLNGATDVFLARFAIGTPVAGPDDSAGSPRLSLFAGPNPSAGAVLVTFTLTHPGGVRLSALDAAGRQINTVFRGFRSEGLHRVTWDGLDSVGRRLPSGVYWLQLEAGGESISRNVIRVR